MESLHPTLILFATGLLVVLTRDENRRIALLMGTFLSVVTVFQLHSGSSLGWEIMGYELRLLRVDALSHVFAIVLSAAAFLASIYSLHRLRGTEVVAKMTARSVRIRQGNTYGNTLPQRLESLALTHQLSCFSRTVGDQPVILVPGLLIKLRVVLGDHTTAREKSDRHFD